MSLPIFDASSHGEFTGLSGTIAHIVTNSHSNLVLIVDVTMDSASDIVTGITYAGQALTELTSIASSGHRIDRWYRLNPATGTNNIVVSTSGGTNTFAVDAASYYNVAQSSTFGTPATATGNSGSPSNTVVTTSTTQLVIDGLFSTPGTSFTQPNGETVEVTDTTVWLAALGDIPATGSNMTLTWTVTTTEWAQISVAMNVAPSSGPTRFITSMDPLMS